MIDSQNTAEACTRNRPPGRLNASSVYSLKTPEGRAKLAAASTIWGCDLRDRKSYVLYEDSGAPNGCTPNPVTYLFNPTTPEAAFLILQVQQLKGHCRSLPPQVRNLYTGRPIAVADACRKHSVSPRQARRWLKDREKPLLQIGAATSTLRWLVDEDAFERLAKRGRSRGQRSVQFYENCRTRGVDPKDVLQTIVFSRFREDSITCDMDLAYAAMCLTLTPDSDFLHYLGAKKPLDRTFASEIARLLNGPYEEISCDDIRFKKLEFQRFWKEQKRLLKEILDGESEVVPKNLLTGEPKYLERLKCPAVPEWAKKSVLPFRVTERIARILKEIYELARRDPHFRGDLEDITREIAELTPTIIASARTAKGRDPETEEAMIGISHKLKKQSGHKGSTRACWAFLRRIHQDRIQAVRKAIPGHLLGPPGKQKFVFDWLGPVGARKYSRAVVNRIFASGRSVEV
jgi:hypothetical protein